MSIFTSPLSIKGFPGSSAGKESVDNAGDPSSTHGSGRSAGGWIGYPLEYSWVSLVAQTIKNPPLMQETWVRSLGWEDPLEKRVATHSSILAWRIPWKRNLAGYSPWSQQRVRHDWATHFQYKEAGEKTSQRDLEKASFLTLLLLYLLHFGNIWSFLCCHLIFKLKASF